MDATDGFPVNSIDDTEEAQQVANIAEIIFDEIIADFSVDLQNLSLVLPCSETGLPHLHHHAQDGKSLPEMSKVIMHRAK